MRRLLVAAAIAAAAGVGAIAVPSDSKSPPTVRVKWVLGTRASAAPGDFAEPKANCPSGYVATGGGVINGALDPTADGPTTNGKGWHASLFNPSSSPQAFDGNVIVV